MYTDLFALDDAARRERELVATLEQRRLAGQRAATTPTVPAARRLARLRRWVVAH